MLSRAQAGSLVIFAYSTFRYDSAISSVLPKFSCIDYFAAVQAGFAEGRRSTCSRRNSCCAGISYQISSSKLCALHTNFGTSPCSQEPLSPVSVMLRVANRCRLLLRSWCCAKGDSRVSAAPENSGRPNTIRSMVATVTLAIRQRASA